MGFPNQHHYLKNILNYSKNKILIFLPGINILSFDYSAEIVVDDVIKKDASLFLYPCYISKHVKQYDIDILFLPPDDECNIEHYGLIQDLSKLIRSQIRVARSDLIKSLTTIFDVLYGQTCYFIIKFYILISDRKIIKSLKFHLYVINELLLIFSILRIIF